MGIDKVNWINLVSFLGELMEMSQRKQKKCIAFCNGRFIAMWLTVIGAITPSGVDAVSFSCKSAKTKIERMICGDGTLSELDDEMANAYARALVIAEDGGALKREQREWIKRERNKCPNSECLKSSYLRRLEHLRLLSKDATDATITADKKIEGEWEPYARAFYNTGIIRISLGSLEHQACKYPFKLITVDGSYVFEAEVKLSCHALSTAHPVNYIKVYSDGSDLRVRFYSTTKEDSLIGEGGYSRVE